MLNGVNLFEQNGSSWCLKSVLGCDIRLAGFEPFSGGCRLPLPFKIRRKKCAVNIMTNSPDCFKWAFLASLHKATGNVSRSSSYTEYETLYEFDKLKFPMKFSKIDCFEKTLSNKKIAINIFGVNYNGSLLPIRISKNAHAKGFQPANILYIKSAEQEVGHFAAIKNINGMLGSTNKHRKILCYNCLNRLPKHIILSEHLKNCTKFKAQNITMPKLVNGKPPVIKFENLSNQLKCGYCIYADLETLPTKNIGKKNLLGKSTDIYASHEPSGYDFMVIRSDGQVVAHETYRNPDCIDRFFDRMDTVCTNILKQYSKPVAMIPLTHKQKVEHFRAKKCFICMKPLSQIEKVHDHDHISGLYRGAAHLAPCNVNYKQKKKVPIFFHNFKSFDSHLICFGFQKYKGDIQVIPTNQEKYLSIICDKFIFLDSLQFLNAPLSELVQILKNDAERNNNFSELFSPLVQIYGEKHARLLARKGVYMYDYMTDWGKFTETKFPPIEAFYNTLTESHISEEDYLYGKRIFGKFCHNLGDYHDLYLALDTILLGCVFENFRNLTLQHFSLDPCYYFSLAGLTWDCSLKTTGVELEQLMDMEVYNALETSLRGGVSMITKRKHTARNRYLKNFDPKKHRESYIMYYDKNSLYSEAMLEYLPVRDFKLVKKRKIINNWTKDKILSIPKNSNTGYIFEVSMSYPKDIHNKTNCYPLAPEKIAVPLVKLSNYQRKLNKTLGIKYNDKIEKLIPHLGSRNHYLTHYRNLQYYLGMGMVLTKVHRVIQFTQEPWQRKFIELCAQQRALSTDKFTKDFWKSLMNQCFGKTCENLRRRKTIKIVNNLKQARKLVSQANFLSVYNLTENLCIFVMAKPRIELNKPLYVGFSVLELSKYFMYKFHYGKIKKWYKKDKATLLATDTDSLIYAIYTDDVYKDMLTHQNEFDTSDYDKRHPLYSRVNCKKIGCMKDENNGNLAKHFVGISPKMYCIVGPDVDKKAAKGVKKYIIKSKLRYQTYNNVLKNQTKLSFKMNCIRSKRHKLYNVRVTKAAMHAFDTKRFIAKNGIETYAFNHYRLKTKL